MRLTALLIFLFQTTLKAKSTFGSLAALTDFKKGVNWYASFVNIVPTTVMLNPVFLSFDGAFVFFLYFSVEQNLHVLIDLITTNYLSIIFACSINI